MTAECGSHILFELMRMQVFNNVLHLLHALSMTYQQRIGGIHDYGIMDADENNQATVSMDEASAGIMQNDIPLNCIAMIILRSVVIHCSPVAYIAPAK